MLMAKMFSRLRCVCRFGSPCQRLFNPSSKRLRVNFASTAHLKSPVPTVVSLRETESDGTLHVTWNDNRVNRYPFVFLRDICRCPECFHESSLQRRFDTVGQLRMDIQPKRVDILQSGTQIAVTWPDEHVSVFDSEWLHSRRLAEKSQEAEAKEDPTLNKAGVIFWNAEQLQDKIPRHDFHEVMEDDYKLYEWLVSLHSLGIALVTNTPLQTGECFKLCSRVGFSKTTHYGHSTDVRAKFDANNLAYTTDGIPLHGDLPYLDYQPGVQLLHCIEQVSSEGGVNQFSDGFHAAKTLKEIDPESFKLLSTTPIQFRDRGKDVFGDFHMKSSHATIELDDNGKLSGLALNDTARDSFMNLPPEKAVELYEAYLKYGRILRGPINQIEYKMVPGDVISFNNKRVFHGRSAFQLTETSGRFLELVYMDWDTINSKLRVLTKHFNIPFGL